MRKVSGVSQDHAQSTIARTEEGPLAPVVGRTLRVIADGLVAHAEELPRESDAARLLRDAATSLLDADSALERSRETQ